MLLKEFHAMSPKKETITYKVSIEELGLRLDQFLSNNISVSYTHLRAHET